MPNIRRQAVYPELDNPLALEIVASDGREFTLTKAQLLGLYLALPGGAARRRRRVVEWLKLSIIAVLGVEQVSLAELDYDFDPASGEVTTATIGMP